MGPLNLYMYLKVNNNNNATSALIYGHRTIYHTNAEFDLCSTTLRSSSSSSSMSSLLDQLGSRSQGGAPAPPPPPPPPSLGGQPEPQPVVSAPAVRAESKSENKVRLSVIVRHVCQLSPSNDFLTMFVNFHQL